MLNNDVSSLNLGRKELLAMIAALMALMALGIDMLLPAFDDIRVAYGLSDLAKEQLIASKYAKEAIKKYNIDDSKPMPTKL